MSKPRRCWPLLLLLALSLSGCHLIWVRKVRLSSHLLNDDNRLLSIEGRSNLPEESLMEAVLSDSKGRRWASGKGQLHDGRFFIVVDISRCPGFRTLTLDLSFDPLVASAKVQEDTGPRGEALGGPLVVDSHDRNMIMDRQFVMLEMTQREAALRRLEQGDGDVKELESYLVRHPNDGEALIGLGLAYLKQRPSERHPGSNANTLLERGLFQHTKAGRLEIEARLWIARLKADAEAAKALRERLHKTDTNPLLETESLVVPGAALGVFKMGMPYRFLMRHFALDHSPDFDNQQGSDTFHVQDRADLEIKVDRASSSVVGASSDSRFFHLANGIRVGSQLDDLRTFVSDISIHYGPDSKGEDGKMHARGVVELQGLNVTVERSYDPQFPIPMEIIVRLEVIKEEVGPASTPTPSLDGPPRTEPTPSVEHTPSVDSSPSDQ